MYLKLHNCFDSHVHWLFTGQSTATLNLGRLRSPSEVSKLEVKPWHYSGEWLEGFGWDQNLWSPAQFPSRDDLDRIFPNIPVAFNRADGHALWLNTEALKRAGLMHQNLSDPKGGMILRDPSGLPTGILIDRARELVSPLIPLPESEKVKSFLLRGIRYFNSRGFTHIRDLSCSSDQWHQVVNLDRSGALTLAVEQFFDAENPDDFEKALRLATNAKKEKLTNVRVRGIKVYFDGALGSEGAFLSCPYCTGSGRGFTLTSLERLSEMMRETWRRDLDLAVHVIGDEAAHLVVHQAHDLSLQGITGRLHLEHAQMLRPETIEMMKGLAIQCHMQPCHWLSDHRWLKQKIGPLMKFVFPWQALELAKIPIHFGSDSPIEESSFMNTVSALDHSSRAGIPALKNSPYDYHVHADLNWTPDTYSMFYDHEPSAVIFRGRTIFTRGSAE